MTRIANHMTFASNLLEIRPEQINIHTFKLAAWVNVSSKFYIPWPVFSETSFYKNACILIIFKSNKTFFNEILSLVREWHFKEPPDLTFHNFKDIN